MAHASDILIPARLVFRPYRGQWHWTRATVLGWGIAPGGTSQMILLLNDMNNEPGPTLTGESVIVRILVWRGKDETELAPVLPREPIATNARVDEYEVEVKREDLPPGCLKPHENPKSTPDIAGRKFDLLVCRLPAMNAQDPSIKPGDAVKDAWKMRAQFLALRDDLSETSRFLNRWGLWCSQLVREPEPSQKAFPGTLVFPHRLWSLRDTYTNAMAGAPGSWLSTATPLSLKETDKPPYFIVERSYCEDAIKATITIDLLADVKFGICKRHDCRKLFERKTKQKRFYCTQECAHLANVRKLRKAKAKSTVKETKNNAKG